jgi:AraC family transcriptional regulator
LLKNTSELPAIADVPESFRCASPRRSQHPTRSHNAPSSRLRIGPYRRSAAHVEISPSLAVERLSMTGRGTRAELLQATSRNRIEFRYCGTSHLVLAYEQGQRRKGETFVDGVCVSTLRDVARKLTFFPAGHDYFEWHELRSPARLLCIYLDPAGLDVQPALSIPSSPLCPRLFFQDASLWSTLGKLKGLVASADRESVPYFEALGAVLMHELLRLSGCTIPSGPLARGGLAAWQRRLVASYVEEHLSEAISLSTLAYLVRLSPYHFSRVFKQSFGMPPHRYHTHRRIERAKILLGQHAFSVTDIGLSLGFNETSSFTTAFRKIAGLTPSRYQRSISRLPAPI